MNKYLITIGFVCALLWGLITAISFGLPQEWCPIIDQITSHLFSDEVYRLSNGFHYDVRNNDMPTVTFLCAFAIIFILTCALIPRIKRSEFKKSSLGIIVGFAIFFRVITVFGVLIHENDIYRYVWDAKSSLAGINPYKYAPADLHMYEEGYDEDHYDNYNEVTIKTRVFDEDDEVNLGKLIELRDENRIFYERIGHWQVPTIYPPVAQGLFTIPIFSKRHSLVLMKLFFILFDIGTLFVIIALLKYFKINPLMSLIYGWSPLVVFEIANAGHYDSIVIFFMMLSLLLYFKGRHIAGVGVLALSFLSKFFSGVLLPILMMRMMHRKKIFAGFVFMGVIVLGYLPFFLWDNLSFKQMFQGLNTYNAEWSYNASVFAFVYATLESFLLGSGSMLMVSKVIVGTFYLGALGWLVFAKERDELDVLHKCFLAISVLFIINPVGDPWYYCWVVPFLCFFPYRAWILLSGLLMFSYINFHSDIAFLDARFYHIPIVNWIIYTPFVLFLIADNFLERRKT